MRKILALVLLSLLGIACFAQSASQTEAAPAKLFFVFLNRPANAPTYSTEKGEEIQAGHMANMKRLYGEGKLMMAGPFMDDTKMRGIFVFKADNLEEVQQWIATDPAVKAGRLEGDVHPWKPGLGEIHHLDAEGGGMEPYVMLIYHWGESAKSLSEGKVKEAFQGHRVYQAGLYKEGKTEIGGPFSDMEHGDFIGVVIAHGKKANGDQLAAADPVVSSGVAKVETHEWITMKGVLYH